MKILRVLLLLSISIEISYLCGNMKKIHSIDVLGELYEYIVYAISNCSESEHICRIVAYSLQLDKYKNHMRYLIHGTSIVCMMGDFECFCCWAK